MMRLTLRTLLAYLDDMLEPADTKIIGQKIQESPMAQLLVSRIREVMRRRRLGAPDVFGPEMGMDPNIVAQYLDNTLRPERYADVERVLLASDEMLAEVAACHEVLTVDPPEVAQSTRDRLYALGPVDPESQLLIPIETSQSLSSRTPHSIPIRNELRSSGERAAGSRHVDEERITTLPEGLKRPGWTRRIIPTAIVVLLALVSAAMLAPEFWTRVRQVNNEIKRKDGRNKTAMNASQDTAAEVHESESAASAEGTIAPESRDAKSTGAAATTSLTVRDPNPPEDESDDVPAVASGKSTSGLIGKKKPGAEPAVEAVQGGPSNETPEAQKSFALPPEPTKEIPVAYASTEGVLLRFDPGQHHWFLIPHRSEVRPGERIANIEPFDGILDFDQSGVRATLVGETSVNLLTSNAIGAGGLSILRGKVVIQNDRQEGNQPNSIGIGIGEDVWTLELLSRDTVCGLEVAPRQSDQLEKLVGDNWYQATLYVISGSVRWTTRDGKSQDVGDRLALNIMPEKNLQARSSPIAFPSVPDWCDSAKRKAMPIRKHQAQILFEKAFELNQPIDESMLNLVKNSKFPKIAELAAQCLAATDDYESLVEILAECPYEEARFAAREGLRQWLPLNAERGPKLKSVLDLYYPPTDAEAVYQMLWGFSRDDVVNSKSNSWLFMNWMRSPKVEIRELADYWVERLMEKKTEYRAFGGTAAQRESQIRRLEEMIEKYNGLIKAQ